MYIHANGSTGMMCELIENLDGNELEITLAQEDATVYISVVHRIDIKAVLAAEEALFPADEDERAA